MPAIPSTPLNNKTSKTLRTPGSSFITPKRPGSISSISSASDLSNRLSRAGSGSSLLSTTHKKYKAPLSVESRKTLKSNLSTSKSLPPVPGTPTKGGSTSRPRTPASPKKGEENLSLLPATSEMDVSNVDPEQVLVDYQTVEPGDVSFDAEDHPVEADKADDKVMVSVRMRPSNNPSAWSPNSNEISLLPAYHKPATPAPTFTFDSVLTGSENKPIYITTARKHVRAAMEGYNAVVFAYGQTASGKTYTLTGDETEPGIVPRATRDIFSYIRNTPEREYLLRCSYLEIYNETIIDLLAPPSLASANPVQIQGTGNDITLVPLREEVVTSLAGVNGVLKRGEGNRRTASTDWNERSSRSHSVFRVVIESRERREEERPVTPVPPSGRHTPGLGGRQTPGLGGARLQARGGRSVRTSVLSLIDLAGSEKATSDKERTREGKYINTSLLTLGTVIGTLAENAAKGKTDHVPYRNSKLTRILQPSLSGNARISVICTINPDPSAVMRRVKGVHLNAQKKEIVDTDALIERYRKEIEDLKRRLAEREADAPVRNRRLSAREQIDETKAMGDLNARIKQLTKLILTSQTVDDAKSDDSRPVSPTKVDFDMSPYQLQQELLAARMQMESQANQLLSLEAALIARPPLPPTASESEKDKLIAEQGKTIRELEIVVRGYEENLGEPLRKVKEDVEREWKEKFDEEARKREEKERWAEEVVKQLDKEKKARKQLEEERRALAAFVSKFDALGLGLGAASVSKLQPPKPIPGGAAIAFSERQQTRQRLSLSSTSIFGSTTASTSKVLEEEEHDITPTSSPVPPTTSVPMVSSPVRLELSSFPAHLVCWTMSRNGLMERRALILSWSGECYFAPPPMFGVKKLDIGPATPQSPVREVLGDKENIAPAAW
ncbi:kinesin motor domain-containing protein [Cyathus striatus]|nr:kinesin motor domain-containing protein [Cyathus striatus]